MNMKGSPEGKEKRRIFQLKSNRQHSGEEREERFLVWHTTAVTVLKSAKAFPVHTVAVFHAPIPITPCTY